MILYPCRAQFFGVFLAIMFGLSACSGDKITGDKTGAKQDFISKADLTLFTSDPVGMIGHGAMTGPDGKNTKLSPALIASMQKYYTDELLSMLDDKQRDKFLNFRGVLSANKNFKPQNIKDQLVLETGILLELIDRAEIDKPGRLQGKIRFLGQAARDLPGKTVNPNILDFVNEFSDKDLVILKSTVNIDQDYITECANEGVPTPPAWGNNQWVSTGSLTNSQEFISAGSVAKPHVYISSTSPAGVCIALPRENTAGTSSSLLGIICQGEVSGKACFWDNQRNGFSFNVPTSLAGQTIPILDPNPAVDDPNIPNHTDGTDMDFAGGAELNGGMGGECTMCHAGENVFVLHPITDLQPNLGGSDTMPAVWHEPIVHPDWVQNPGPGTLASTPEAIAAGCAGCHDSSFGGRFPKLSSDYWRNPNTTNETGYCVAVLKRSFNIDAANPNNTMPLFSSQLSPAIHADLEAKIDDFCDGDPANAEGDPHIKTTNGIRYDFHGSGEFVLLKGYDNFEVQMRSRALATDFFPGPNGHTGIASCVSSISAIATRVGSDKITYQPGLDGIPDPAGMELRVNGGLRSIPVSGLTLPGGGLVTKNGNLVEIVYPEGEIMTLIPRFWAGQGHWNLNVSVVGAEANRGVMGMVKDGWLPEMPNGVSLGPKPASISQRKTQLYAEFANAWRVKNTESLFDYSSGQSGANFTIPSWPKDSAPCEVPDIKLVPKGDLDTANNVCKGLTDKTRRENCVFDVLATGDKGFADQFMLSEKAATLGTLTKVEFGKGLPKFDKPPFLMANVSLKTGGLKRVAKGRVQFYFDQKPFGESVKINARGYAVLLVGKEFSVKRAITARFLPDDKQGYLPSVGRLIIKKPNPSKPYIE